MPLDQDHCDHGLPIGADCFFCRNRGRSVAEAQAALPPRDLRPLMGEHRNPPAREPVRRYGRVDNSRERKPKLKKRAVGAAAPATQGGQCQATNRDGGRCQRFARNGTFCLLHDPERPADRERWRAAVAASHKSLNRARALQHLKKALAALSEEKGADSALYAVKSAIAILERNGL